MIRALRLALAAWVLGWTMLSPAAANSPASRARAPAAAAQPLVAETPFAQRLTAVLATDVRRAAQEADVEIARLERAGAGARPSELAGAYWIAAQAAFRSGDAAGAERFLSQVERLSLSADQRRWRTAQAALLRGLMARGRGDFGEALLLYRRAQRGFIAAGDTRGQGQALQALGLLYIDVGDGESALRYLNLARETYGGDDLFLLTLYNNLGAAYQSLETREALTQSEQMLSEALIIAERVGNTAYARHIRINLAASEFHLDRFDLARRHLLELGPPQDIADPGQRSNALRILALIAEREGRHGSAEQLIRNAVAGLDPAQSDSVFRPAHFAAYRIFARANKVQDALAQLEAVRRIDEADAQLIASNRAALLAAQFQFDAQEARIDRLKAEQLERDIANERTRTLIILVSALAVGLLLAGLLWLAIRSRNRARRDGAALAVVNTQLEGALAAKTEFLASTSHEIRTPLNGILGMTQIMLADNGLPGHMRAQVELVHDAGTTMRALVDDILDVAKMEHGGFVVHARPTDVGELVRRVTRLYGTQAQDRGLALTIDVAPAIGWQDVDPDRLTQILFNLVGNAMKFTQQGGITVALAVDDRADGPALQIAVADTGIGIAPEWHEAVFEMFRQVDGTRKRNYGGTGLGLAICRQLAQAMGGDISLDSEEGVGSTFRVTLPWRPVAEPAVLGRMAVPAFATGKAEASRQLAIVGADPMRLSMLMAIAREAGFDSYPIRTAADLDQWLDGPTGDWLVDARALGQLADWAGARQPLAGRVLLAGSNNGSDSDEEGSGASLFKELVTMAPFSRSKIIAATATWVERTHMGRPAASFDSAADVTQQWQTGSRDMPQKRAAGL